MSDSISASLAPSEARRKDLVRVPCNLCGADRPVPVLVENGFPICRCASCGLVYVSPRPAFELGDDVDHFNETEEADAIRENGEQVYDEGLDVIERETAEKGWLLDVGCGFGFFVKRAAERGWVAHGVDVSEVGVGFARGRLGLEFVQRADLLQAHYPSGRFQAVTFWNCLEHLPLPRETLDEAGRILCEGGVLMVRVPNIEFSRRFRPLMRFVGLRDWSYLCTPPPQHLYGFTPRTLRLLLQRAGFQVMTIQPATVKVVHYERANWRAGLAAKAMARMSDLTYRVSGGHWHLSATMVAWARKQVAEPAGSRRAARPSTRKR